MAIDDPDREAHQRELISQWVRDHGRSVLGYLIGLVRDRPLAEDLLQEVFCRAWQARDRYTDTGHARAYLLRIADRLACDRARRPRRERDITADDWRNVEPADDVNPWETICRQEAEQQLAAALDELSEAQRRTLLLRYYGDLDFAEIAETLRLPLNTVLSHNRRGLLTLRRLLAEKTNDERPNEFRA